MATNEERLTAIKEMDFNKIKDIGELRKIWGTAVGTVGHKVLGRMLLGETAEHALRIN